MRATLLTAALALLTPALATSSSDSSSSSSTSTSTASASTASEDAVPLKIPYWPDPPKEVLIETIFKPDDCTVKSKQGDRLYTMYNGTYTHPRTGKVITFDTTYDEEMKPFIFFLKAGQVIQGFDIGFDDMCIGEKRKIVVPPDFAYGKRGRVPHIPGWATLVFDAQLMHIQQIDWAEQARKAKLAEEEEKKKEEEQDRNEVIEELGDIKDEL